MNKKFFLAVMLICFISATVQAQEPVVLIAKTSTGIGSEMETNVPRSPIYIPSVFLSDYTLLFEECCFGCEIEIMENDEVVYSTIITDANGTVQLPEDLSGNFELCLYRGSFVFVGEIEV